MKISLDWLSQYITDLPDVSQLTDILTEIGLEVEGVEKIASIPGGLKGVVIGQVKETAKHPNADRLSVNKVDIGEEELLNIVCGAPNVAAGQKVLVAPVGTTLYDAEGKSWTIKKSKIRGEVSEGMICAEDELGIGSDHSGIMVLPDSAQIGVLASDHFQVAEDVVFDIGLTPNRSDATSHFGVASDLSAALSINHGHNGKVSPPSVDDFNDSNPQIDISVEVLNHEACPRYAGVVIKDIHIKESPRWMKDRLEAVGVRSINNVVDITNYVLHELGQPLHAFDLEKIGGNKIIVRTLPEGTKFTTLDEQERSLGEEDLMICDGQSSGMCIGGVFGGRRSGVTEGTTAIFLESAHFSPKWIRRTASRHGLNTDASRTFEKGSDPNVCVVALKRAAMLLEKYAEGKVASKIIDVYPQPIEPVAVRLRYERLNRLVGAQIPPGAVKQILSALKMSITIEDEASITVEVPTNKTDVTREADLIEEVLRIYGFNRVPLPSKMSISAATTKRPDPIHLRNQVADYLVAMGFHETMGMSMVDNRYFEGIVEIPEEDLVRINNTSNVQVEVMRPTMLLSALETILHNQNRQQTNLRLFEFGHTYRKRASEYVEKHHLTITCTGWEAESWLNALDEDPNHPYFALKSIVENVLQIAGLKHLTPLEVSGDSMQFGLQYQSSGGEPFVTMGRVSKDLCQKIDVRGAVFHADFDWQLLVDRNKVDQIIMEQVSKYPTLRRDLALVVDQGMTFEAIKSLILREQQLVKDVNLFDVYIDDKVIGSGKKSYAVSLILGDENKTLSDKEVDEAMNSLLSTLEKELNAKLR